MTDNGLPDQAEEKALIERCDEKLRRLKNSAESNRSQEKDTRRQTLDMDELKRVRRLYFEHKALFAMTAKQLETHLDNLDHPINQHAPGGDGPGKINPDGYDSSGGSPSIGFSSPEGQRVS